MNEPRSTPPSADDEPDRDTVWLLSEGAGDALAEWCARLVQEARENGGRVPSLRRMTKKGLAMSRPEPTADSIAAFGPRPALLPRLSLVVIRAVDPRRLADFYAALGMAFEIERHRNGPAHFVSNDTGITFEIYPRRDDEPATTGIRLGFTTVALDAVLKAMKDCGGQIVTPATVTAWGRRAVLIDPEGHKVEITEKP